MFHPKRVKSLKLVYHATAALFLLMSMTSKTFALPEDKSEILHLSASTADINQKTHRGAYHGKIEFDQGTTHLRADDAITIGDKDNHIIKAIAKGGSEPAHFWTQAKKDEAPMHAYAKTIIYEPNLFRIQLIGEAKVLQGDNSFSAPKIVFNTKTQHVITTPDAHSQTVIIIHPKDMPHDPAHR